MDGSLLVATPFDLRSVSRTRCTLSRWAVEQGLAGERLLDFVFAVNECVINAVRHGGGRGRLRMWREGDELCCEIADEGGGFPARRLSSDLPGADAVGGRGLWLVRNLVDRVGVTTGAAGSSVLVAMRTGAGEQGSS
ncbi:ATP-binding protein [Nonomuraea sp. NPDC050310]|uniref:ATP-binding protein n=1 Tax=Nonomuraea sp. NPDC050310 TaxID=3154935 RepID=UPI0034045323